MTNPQVAVYVRLSQDRDGTKTSTQRQEADCRSLAKARGWQVAEVYRDNDRSAFNGKERPAFDRMLRAIGAGGVQGVVAWKVDRLGRRTADVVSLLADMSKRGGFVATCDGLDSSSATGKAVMQIGGIFAELESENIAARVRRAKLQGAEEGRPSGGGRRPYGYTSDGVSVVEDEAVRIREATAAILAGRSVRSIAADWNATGVKTSEGSAWFPQTLRRILVNPRLAGLRTHHGEVVADGKWPAIITRTQHEQLVAILTDPNRRSARSGARRYLLTGTAFCGQCGSALVAHPSGQGRSYACRSQRRGTGCGGVRILAEPFEEYVAEQLLDALDTPALTRLRRAAKGTDADKLARQLRTDERSLEQLANDYYVERRIGRREFTKAHKALTKRVERLRHDLAEDTVVHALPSAGQELRRQWEAADVDWRRSVVDAVIERIDVGASRARGQTDLGRVAITWRA